MTASREELLALAAMQSALRQVRSNARFDWLGRDTCNAVTTALDDDARARASLTPEGSAQ